jgi:TonB-linked SusC/RagA family outer membrane protein
MNSRFRHGSAGNLLKKMKLLVAFFFLGLLSVSASTYSQQTKFSIKFVDITVKDVFKQIESQSEFVVFYNEDFVDVNRKVNLNVEDQNVEEILNEVFRGTNNTYRIYDRQIVILEREKNDLPPAIKSKDTFEQPALKQIKGKVTDSKGEPIPGASVIVKGSTTGIVTNMDGQFSLSIPQSAQILLVSFVGMKSEEVFIGSNLDFFIVLKEETFGLDEVVAVGYGIQKKASLTAAISNITTKELTQSPQANISNMLVGRLPGLLAVQRSGEPGNDQSTIRIRGTGTFASGADPLVMVDGIERTNYNDIDPNEIDNLSILKDASATALYGVRGANGVILITTKRGQTSSKPTVNYSANYAVRQPTMLPKYLGSYDYARLFNEGAKNDEYTDQTSNQQYLFSDEDIELYRTGVDPLFHPSVNWIDLFVKDYSMQQQHNLNISGGSKDTRYFISVGYFTQDGIYNSTDLIKDYNVNIKYDRYNFRSNLDFDITKYFSAAVTLSGIIENTNYPNSSAATLWQNLSWTNPYCSPGIVDGKVVQIQKYYKNTNPLHSLLNTGIDENFTSTINSAVRLNHKLDFLLKGLAAHATISYDNRYNARVQRSKNIMLYNIYPDPANPTQAIFVPERDDLPPMGYSASSGKFRKIYAEVGLNYNQTFGDHTLSAMILYMQSKEHNPSLQYMVPRGILGTTGRVVYNYKNRYQTELNMGYNGTEKLCQRKAFWLFPIVLVKLDRFGRIVFPEKQPCVVS